MLKNVAKCILLGYNQIIKEIGGGLLWKKNKMQRQQKRLKRK